MTLCTGTRDPEDQWRAHPGNNEPEAWRDLLEAMQSALAIAERTASISASSPSWPMS